MSGHSHWATIKHKKAAVDIKRGKLWSKLARNIIVAAKSGGGDPKENLSLRYAIDKAKEANMPRDTIDKAIKKGTGELGGVNYEEVVYEGYGPAGVAIMCLALTDNRNRTAGEIRKAFDSRGGSLGASGCVSWMFKKMGVFTVDAAAVEEEKLMEVALEAGAEDVQKNDSVFEITSRPEDFETIKKALEEKQIPVQSSEIAQVPATYITLNQEIAKRVLELMEMLEDHEDVQNVYANFDIPQEIMEKLG